MCLLPIFDPDGVVQNPSDFFLFTLWDFIHKFGLCASLCKYRSGAALRLCVKIALADERLKE
jgi:hypothetical protein